MAQAVYLKSTHFWSDLRDQKVRLQTLLLYFFNEHFKVNNRNRKHYLPISLPVSLLIPLEKPRGNQRFSNTFWSEKRTLWRNELRFKIISLLFLYYFYTFGKSSMFLHGVCKTKNKKEQMKIKNKEKQRAHQYEKCCGKKLCFGILRIFMVYVQLTAIITAKFGHSQVYKFVT